MANNVVNDDKVEAMQTPKSVGEETVTLQQCKMNVLSDYVQW